MNSNHEKIVKFDWWCIRCKHFEKDESEDPCYDCLADPTNFESTKPIKFEEKEGLKI